MNIEKLIYLCNQQFPSNIKLIPHIVCLPSQCWVPVLCLLSCLLSRLDPGSPASSPLISSPLLTIASAHFYPALSTKLDHSQNVNKYWHWISLSNFSFSLNCYHKLDYTIISPSVLHSSLNNYNECFLDLLGPFLLTRSCRVLKKTLFNNKTNVSGIV